MTQTLDTQVEATETGEQALTNEALPGRGVKETEHLLAAFVSELQQMTPDERIRASRYSFNRWERSVYAARFPDEVPLVHGELEWIALNLP